MADNTFMVEIVTPEQILLQDEVQFLVVPELNGELGVLKNHAAMIAALDVGVLRYTDPEGKVKKIAISGGFMEVIYNEVRVLAETAEQGSEIDVLRARAAQERAEKRMQLQDENVNHGRAEMAMRRAMTRLKAADALLKE
jgi:F-type H+-transporting ATPase subunit epsilon